MIGTVIGRPLSLLLVGIGLLAVAPARSASETPRSFPTPFAIKGISYPSFRNGDYASAASAASLDDLAATGANWVAIVRTRSTTSIDGADIHATGQTESDANVVQAIADAHARGLSVLLKPHVDSEDGKWRGYFAPVDVDAWFANYRAMILDEARIAAENDVEMLSVGCEYDTLSGADYGSRWTELIAAVRDVYGGPITYASDWIAAKDVSFWAKVDYIGIDAYYPLGDHRDPSVEELVAAWNTVSSNRWTAGNSEGLSPIDFYHRLSSAYGKPLIFTEIGYRSVDGAAMEPNEWQRPGAVDLGEQENAYRALFEVWTRYPSWMKGIFIWDWMPQPKPTTQSAASWEDFTPQDKPAQRVVTEWFAGPSPTASPARGENR